MEMKGVAPVIREAMLLQLQFKLYVACVSQRVCGLLEKDPGLYSKRVKTVSNLFGKFGVILHESSLPWLEGSYTRSDLRGKTNHEDMRSRARYLN